VTILARWGHAGSVDNEPQAPQSRRETARRRLDAIHTRIGELQASGQGDASPAAIRERLTSAQRHLAAAQAAAERAIAASVRAFRRAAEAHEHAAIQHARAAAAGFGDKDEHERHAAIHRAAAVADRQRAERAQSLLGDEEADDGRGPHVDQALNRLVNLAARRTAGLPPLEPGARVRILLGRLRESGRPGVREGRTSLACIYLSSDRRPGIKAGGPGADQAGTIGPPAGDLRPRCRAGAAGRLRLEAPSQGGRWVADGGGD
jgi:hypothetical protein